MRTVTPKKNGPAKTPTKTLAKRGSWLAKDREKTEPQFESARPAAPKELKGKARRTWTEMVKLLDDAGVLTRVDGKALARYCRLWAQWLELVDFDDQDIEIRSVDDLKIVHQNLDKSLKISDALLKFEVQYGMTPASRPNVHRLDKPAHGNAKQGKERFFNTG